MLCTKIPNMIWIQMKKLDTCWDSTSISFDKPQQYTYISYIYTYCRFYEGSNSSFCRSLTKKTLSFIGVMLLESQAVCKKHSALQHTVQGVVFSFMDIALQIYCHIWANHRVKEIPSLEQTVLLEHM